LWSHRRTVTLRPCGNPAPHPLPGLLRPHLRAAGGVRSAGRGRACPGAGLVIGASLSLVFGRGLGGFPSVVCFPLRAARPEQGRQVTCRPPKLSGCPPGIRPISDRHGLASENASHGN
jgi:hypothetical protein